MPDERIIQEIQNILSDVVELGGQEERTSIVPNMLVRDASPTDLDDYVIIADNRDNDNILALRVPGVVYADNDLVNVIFPAGGEAIAFQQGSQSTTSGLWDIVPGTDDIYYDKGDVGIGKSVAPDAALEILDTSQAQLRLTFEEDTKFADFTVDTNHDLTIKPSSTGQVIFQPTTDSTDFLQVLDADGGTPILNVDSTNENVGIGTVTPDEELDVIGNIGLTEVLYINESVNTFQTRGATLNQGTATNEIIALKQSAISHPFTSRTEADTYGLQKRGGANGGITIEGFSAGSIGMFNTGYTGTEQTGKATTALGAVSFLGRKSDGGTGFTQLSSNANLIVFRNDDESRWVLSGGGEMHIIPGSDTSLSLIELHVTDTPTFAWDETENAFELTHGLHIDVATNAGAYRDDDLIRVTNYDNDGGAPQILMRFSDENANDDLVFTRTTDADPSDSTFYIRGSLGLGVASPSTKLDIGAGAMEFEEMTAPAAGAANTARLFAQDNGAGKTQLAVRFNTGAIQILATEP